MSAPKSPQQKFFFGLLAVAALLLISPTLIAAVKSPEPPKNPPVLVGTTDPEPPVVKGGAGTWEELFQKEGNNPQYWSCFTQRTGHSKEEALQALAREREGWNVAVTIVSNTSVTTGDAALDSKGIPRDPDIVQLNGFSNTRGAGEGNCQAFDDQRAQVRVALTLPGKDAQTPGLPVVLGHCGNPIGYPQGPPPPATPTPQSPPSHGTPPTPPGPKPPKPPVTPTTVPPKPGKCANQGQYCGTPDSGPELDPVQSNPQPTNPSDTPNGPNQYGTNTGGSQVGPTNNYSGTGASNPTSGTNKGVTNDPTGPAATANNPATGSTSTAGSDPGGF